MLNRGGIESLLQCLSIFAEISSRPAGVLGLKLYLISSISCSSVRGSLTKLWFEAGKRGAFGDFGFELRIFSAMMVKNWFNNWNFICYLSYVELTLGVDFSFTVNICYMMCR